MALEAPGLPDPSVDRYRPWPSGARVVRQRHRDDLLSLAHADGFGRVFTYALVHAPPGFDRLRFRDRRRAGQPHGTAGSRVARTAGVRGGPPLRVEWSTC